MDSATKDQNLRKAVHVFFRVSAIEKLMNPFVLSYLQGNRKVDWTL